MKPFNFRFSKKTEIWVNFTSKAQRKIEKGGKIYEL